MPHIQPPPYHPTSTKIQQFKKLKREYEKIPHPPSYINKIDNIFQTLAGIIAYIFMIGLIILSILALIPTQAQ